MKKLKYIIAIAVAMVAFNACKNGANLSEGQLKSVKVQTGKDTFSYFMGLNISKFMKSKGLKELNHAAFQKGMAEGFVKDSNFAIPIEKLEPAVKAYENSVWGKINAEVLAANAKKEGIKTTESGLQYEVIQEGSGNKVMLTDSILLNYKGTLADGSTFDMTRGKPAKMNVNGVIPGFMEALQLMSEGSKYVIHIPSKLAYGERGIPRNQFSPGILPNSMLKFELEIVKILGEDNKK